MWVYRQKAILSTQLFCDTSTRHIVFTKYLVSVFLCGWSATLFILNFRLGQPKKKNLFAKIRVAKKNPPCRQGIHFFPNFHKIHTIQVFKGTNKINGRLKSTKQIGLLCCQPLITSFEWRSPRIRSYFNSYPLSPPKHLNNNNRTSDVRV